MTEHEAPTLRMVRPEPAPMATVSFPVYSPCLVEVVQFAEAPAARRAATRSGGYCVELPSGHALVIRDRDLPPALLS